MRARRPRWRRVERGGGWRAAVVEQPAALGLALPRVEVGEVGREAGGVGGDSYEDGSEDRTSRKMASIRLLSDSSRRMLYPLGGADPATSEANSDAVASSEANLGEAASSTAHRSRQTSASMPSSLPCRQAASGFTTATNSSLAAAHCMQRQEGAASPPTPDAAERCGAVTLSQFVPVRERLPCMQHQPSVRERETTRQGKMQNTLHSSGDRRLQWKVPLPANAVGGRRHVEEGSRATT